MNTTVNPLSIQQAVQRIASCDRMAASGNQNFTIGHVHFINCLRPIILDGRLRPMRGYDDREARVTLN